jgi:hypothetical protein
MPHEENRYVHRVVDKRLQPSMDAEVGREFGIRLDRVRNAIVID